MPNEYIDREAALSEVDKQIEKNPFGAIAYAAIAIKSMLCDIPAADVAEVVRCKDCFKRSTDQCPMYEDSEELTHDWTQDDWYCSLGERMDGGESHAD